MSGDGGAHECDEQAPRCASTERGVDEEPK